MEKYDWWTMDKKLIMRAINEMLEHEKVQEFRLRLLNLLTDVGTTKMDRKTFITKVVQTFQHPNDIEIVLQIAKEKTAYEISWIGSLILKSDI